MLRSGLITAAGFSGQLSWRPIVSLVSGVYLLKRNRGKIGATAITLAVIWMFIRTINSVV
jgi:hypothetical protein